MFSDFEGSDREWEVTELEIIEAVEYNKRMYFLKQPYRDDPFRGGAYVNRVLNGHENRCLDLFRMKTNVLRDLSDALKTRGLLRDTRYVIVEEQLGIFLYTIWHNDSNRNVADRFQHSQETISRHFGTVLKAICKFSKEVILPPDFNTPHPYMLSMRNKYLPWFQNCVGAIDGTHIHAAVPSGKKQILYRGRKSIATQNVMYACDFGMCFTFVLDGWEGTSNDSRVFAEALANDGLKFPHPPTGKFYLVDSGYPNKSGYLAPYKGDRYHLNEYRGRRNHPKTAKEQFNYAHSSLRNVIKRSFRVLKCHFPILKLIPPFSLRKQRNIVIAACTIHNFIRRHNLEDEMFNEYVTDDMDDDDDNNDGYGGGVRSGSGPSISTSTMEQRGGPSGQSTNAASVERRRRQMNNFRDDICRRMAIFYRPPL